MLSGDAESSFSLEASKASFNNFITAIEIKRLEKKDLISCSKPLWRWNCPTYLGKTWAKLIAKAKYENGFCHRKHIYVHIFWHLSVFKSKHKFSEAEDGCLLPSSYRMIPRRKRFHQIVATSQALKVTLVLAAALRMLSCVFSDSVNPARRFSREHDRHRHHSLLRPSSRTRSKGLATPTDNRTILRWLASLAAAIRRSKSYLGYSYDETLFSPVSTHSKTMILGSSVSSLSGGSGWRCLVEWFAVVPRLS